MGKVWVVCGLAFVLTGCNATVYSEHRITPYPYYRQYYTAPVYVAPRPVYRQPYYYRHNRYHYYR
jgi:hypothetical protein